MIADAVAYRRSAVTRLLACFAAVTRDDDIASMSVSTQRSYTAARDFARCGTRMDGDVIRATDVEWRDGSLKARARMIARAVAFIAATAACDECLQGLELFVAARMVACLVETEYHKTAFSSAIGGQYHMMIPSMILAVIRADVDGAA